MLSIDRVNEHLDIVVPASHVHLVLTGLAALERGEAHEHAFSQVNLTPPCGNGDLSGCQMGGVPDQANNNESSSTGGPRVLIRRASGSSVPTNATSVGAQSLFGDDPCGAIGAAISNHRFAWAQKKINASSGLLSLSDLASIDPNSNRPTIRPGLNPLDLIVEMLVSAKEEWQGEVEGSILTVLWNRQHCYGRTILVGPLSTPYNWGGAQGGGIPLVYRCNTELWQISYDGGNTWTSIPVKECQFAPPMN
ncbi:MAG: hypothetical protein MUF00_19470 [Gemmatimonadaceae bacterium]|jgi:hypothetical protein|nr:hypothetical protein [Gemmatimonadaceae bacterium]